MTPPQPLGDREAQIEAKASESLRTAALRDREQQLVEYRDSGVLSDSELEEQRAKLRWSVGS